MRLETLLEILPVVVAVVLTCAQILERRLLRMKLKALRRRPTPRDVRVAGPAQARLHRPGVSILTRDPRDVLELTRFSVPELQQLPLPVKSTNTSIWGTQHPFCRTGPDGLHHDNVL